MLDIRPRLYNIDVKKDILKEIEITTKDLKDYVEEIRENILSETRTREYKIRNDKTEVYSRIVTMQNESSTEHQEMMAIAKRLFYHEKSAQEKIERMGKDIKKGSLIEAIMSDEKQSFYLIAKVDKSTIIDESDLKRHMGLPLEKKEIKTCLFTFDEDNKIKHIFLSDTNAKISDYWWNGFLELGEVRTDENNTSNAFRSIDLILSNSVKKKSQRDHQILRNTVINYFSGNESIIFEDMINDVFLGYIPAESNLQMDVILRKMLELPKKIGFDMRFNSVPTAFDARVSRKYEVTSRFDLVIKGTLYDDDITSIVKVDNEKYLEIKVENDDTFKRFYSEKS